MVKYRGIRKAKLIRGSRREEREESAKEENMAGEEQMEKLEIDENGNILDTVKDSDGGEQGAGTPSAREPEADAAAVGKLTPETGISRDFGVLKEALEEAVGLYSSFDVIFREMVFGGQKTGIFYYNGFAKDFVLTSILERLSYADQIHREERGLRDGPGGYGEPGEQENAEAKLDVIRLFDEALIPHIQVKKTDKLKEAIDNVAMGGTAFFFEGQKEAVLVDAKSFPVRTTQEPDLERVVRGSRDGFVETLLTNVTLVRRRIRDPKLKLEITQVGTRTQSDVCIAYIDDICDGQLVKDVKAKIKEVKVDGLPLAEKQLEEAIVSKRWNPYPMVRYSERPDVVAAHLLEGHVVLFVDTSPSVMILPATFFHHVQHAEEYRQTPAVGTYLRWVRFIGMAMSLFLLPLWFLIVTSPELKPAGLEFIGPQKVGKIPLLGQFLIAELGTDLMRMAAVHTPAPLAIAMGLVAGILIGDVAVKTGLFVNEVILYLSAAAIGTFATPSYELSLANRLARLGLLLAAAFFKVPGFVLASTFLIVYLALQRSYNSPYLWPFIPFNARALYGVMVRRPFMSMRHRMSLTKPQDGTRQPQS
ncbi:spore germination protein [Paenibacillus filicis]|uniref:Spore germination protein n=1 Tax=Paenibacillus gyeongsangnamensis TaxID=3388067 RepID=A0ABT4Q7R7_9BACL|nr:spore germination protein [Paenibacillus filicis]MCZ8512878.1 spore germination protein [Paenibacillus filicis]